jgi:uncharacterized oxidoreductase
LELSLRPEQKVLFARSVGPARERRGDAMELSGNTVPITGGSSRIGYVMASSTRAARSLSAPAQHRHPDLHLHVCDVADDKARGELAAFMANEFPELNVLVNNAGAQRDIDLTKGINEFFAGENEIRVNLETPTILSALLTPLLVRNPRPALVKVSSASASYQWRICRSIVPARGGMHAFSMAMRVQLGEVGGEGLRDRAADGR